MCGSKLCIKAIDVTKFHCIWFLKITFSKKGSYYNCYMCNDKSQELGEFLLFNYIILLLYSMYKISCNFEWILTQLSVKELPVCRIHLMEFLLLLACETFFILFFSAKGYAIIVITLMLVHKWQVYICINFFRQYSILPSYNCSLSYFLLSLSDIVKTSFIIIFGCSLYYLLLFLILDHGS